MQRVSNGYTIIEVLIFLAVSAVMFLSAITVISGRQSKTEFAQTARNLNSQLQDWINDAQTGFPGGTVGQYTCKSLGSKLQIDRVAASVSPSCIFLGKAIQVTDKSYLTDPTQASKIYAYSVFGQRLDSTGQLVTNLSDATPTAAIGVRGGHTGSADLTTEYDLPSDISVYKITSTSGGPSSHMAGFYSSFNTERSTGSNGNEDLVAYQYPLGNEAPKTNSVFDCLLNRPPCSLGAFQLNPSPLGKWQICISNGDQYAVITVSSSSGTNVTTKMDIATACP